MRVAVVRVILGASAMGLAWGCAPYTEQEEYEQADRLNQAREQYVVNKQRCEQFGGAMVMQAQAQRIAEPGYHEYNQAKCVKR